MSGSHHTGRRPNRISSIGLRTPRAIADARRVSEADLRLAIYVRPDGLGIHVVKNPCNDQEYKVADATAGATFSKGAAVVLGSFTGNPGEMILGRPPAGFGGASGYSVNKVNVGYQLSTPTPGGTYALPASPTLLQGMAYCRATDRAILLYGGDAVTGDGAVPAVWLVAVPRASLPILRDDAVAAATQLGVALIPTPDPGAVTGAQIAIAPGPRYLVLYANGTGANSSILYHLVSMDANGVTLATADYYGPSGTLSERVVGYCVSGGKLFLAEPMDSDADLTAGPPYSSLSRLTVRDTGSLEIRAGYDIPSVTPFNGSASVGQEFAGLVPDGSGGVHLYLRVWNGAGTQTTLWRRNLTSALVVSGADVQITNCGEGGGATYHVESLIVRTSAGVRALGVKGGSDIDDFLSLGATTAADIALDLGIGRPSVLDYATDGVLWAYQADNSDYLIAQIDADGTLHLPTP